MYNDYKSNPSDNNVKNQYFDFIKLLKKIIKQAKNEYLKRQVEIRKSNNKKLWEFINFKIKGTQSKKKELEYLVINDNKEYCRKSIANELNKYYADIGINLANKINKPNIINSIPKLNKKTYYLFSSNNLY